MKLEKSDLDRLADVIGTKLEATIHVELRDHLVDFDQYCESPIECLFGVAFHFFANAMSIGRARAKLVYLNDPQRSRKPLLAQWELVPQFVWENYRIDFALFTALDYPILIECDGHEFHERTKEQAAHDREKDRCIQAAGIPILRFTGSQIHADPIECGFEVYNFAVRRLNAARKSA